MLLTESSINVLISLAAVALRCASERTSLATTAKPRPCSPARRFNGRIKRQDIGLKRNAVDNADNLRHALR